MNFLDFGVLIFKAAENGTSPVVSGTSSNPFSQFRLKIVADLKVNRFDPSIDNFTEAEPEFDEIVRFTIESQGE